MNAEKIREPAGQAAVRRYRGYGLFGGVTVGLVAGVLISGPHFDEWSAGALLALVFACAASGALIGWMFLAIAAGAIAGGGTWGAGHVEGGNWSGSDGGRSGGDDGGDV